MCLLLVDHPNLAAGWGCCRCRTYNALRRDRCKFCGELHHPLGTNDTPDVLEARDDEEEEQGCPHDPACSRCLVAAVGSGNTCDGGCGRNLSIDDTIKLYIDGSGRFLAATHVRCNWEPR